MTRAPTITKLELGDYWTARVTQDGITTTVHRQFGSWATDGAKEGSLREIPREWSAALQAKVRPIERAARRVAE